VLPCIRSFVQAAIRIFVVSLAYRRTLSDIFEVCSSSFLLSCQPILAHLRPSHSIPYQPIPHHTIPFRLPFGFPLLQEIKKNMLRIFFAISLSRLSHITTCTWLFLSYFMDCDYEFRRSHIIKAFHGMLGNCPTSIFGVYAVFFSAPNRTSRDPSTLLTTT